MHMEVKPVRVLHPVFEEVRTFCSGMHDVALIEVVVIRCYFNTILFL